MSSDVATKLLHIAVFKVTLQASSQLSELRVTKQIYLIKMDNFKIHFKLQ